MKSHLTLGNLLALLILAAPATAQPPSDALAGRMERLQERINIAQARGTRIDDSYELKNLQGTFGYYFDKGLWDDVVDLFTADATLELGHNGVYAGHDSIRAYLYSLSGGQPGMRWGQLNNHFQLQPVLTLSDDGERANGRWNSLIQTGQYDEEGHGGEWGAGVYENEYRKEDGVWKISRMRFYLEFYAPYDQGWTHGPEAMAADYLRSEVPPDRPSSGDYRSYPAFDIAPFHYDNPVTSGYVFGLSEQLRSAARQAPPPETSDGTVDALEAQVRDLELRVKQLKAHNEIENVEAAYGYYVDQSMGDEIARLFVEDGTLEILGRGVFIGLPRILTYMERLGCCGPVDGTLFNHMQLQHVIHVADDAKTADMRARLFVMFAREGQAAQWGEGVYENRFIKDDGQWKYRNLHGFQTFYTTYEQGWAQWSSPLFNYFEGFPPDRPHSVKYEPYPEVFVPPFRHPNPVTGQAVRIPEQDERE